jgi:uncharacterized membrane protein YeaQ/YmgE (transglycosylase-associated protein family)
MLIVGLFVGAIARFLMPGKDPGGIITTIALGVAGSVAVGLVGRELGWYETGRSAGMIASVIGAVVLLSVYRAFLASRAPRAA